MKVTLFSRTTIGGDELAGRAAAICTRSDNYVRAREQALKSGHLSVAEHVNYTFLIEGVSRSLLAQLTRHRIASFSVESQRYVSMRDGFEYVIPPSIAALGEYAVNEFKYQMRVIHDWYKDWQDRLERSGAKANEDARYVLPNAAATNLMVTMNARELMHFFELRCCNRAQWEIREMAWQMSKQCQEAAPELFRTAGPGCVRGACPEGKRACGVPYGRTDDA